jgi:hypothetical protein
MLFNDNQSWCGYEKLTLSYIGSKSTFQGNFIQESSGVVHGMHTCNPSTQ